MHNMLIKTSYSTYLLLTQDDVVNTKHNKNMMIADTTEVEQFQNQKLKAHKQYSNNTHKLWNTRTGSMEIWNTTRLKIGEDQQHKKLKN